MHCTIEISVLSTMKVGPDRGITAVLHKPAGTHLHAIHHDALELLLARVGKLYERINFSGRVLHQHLQVRQKGEGAGVYTPQKSRRDGRAAVLATLSRHAEHLLYTTDAAPMDATTAPAAQQPPENLAAHLLRRRQAQVAGAGALAPAGLPAAECPCSIE